MSRRPRKRARGSTKATPIPPDRRRVAAVRMYADCAVSDGDSGAEHFAFELQQTTAPHVDHHRADLCPAGVTPPATGAGYAFMADDEVGLAVAREVTLDHGSVVDSPFLPVAGIGDLFANQVVGGFRAHCGRRRKPRGDDAELMPVPCRIKARGRSEDISETSGTL